MNIYQVNDTDGEIGFFHVVAPTRGKAKAEYITAALECNPSECWTDQFTIRLLAKNVDMPEGVDWDFNWAQTNGWEIDDDDGEFVYLIPPATERS